jgi:hypothetical protein
MGRPQVSIRLGTSGRGDVERDFAAIGDAGEAQAKRYQASWERASAEAEARARQAGQGRARMSAASATPLQQQINATTGVGAVQSGNAKAAASALAAELDRAEAEARQLIASIDPLFAAQARYEAQVERINAVKAPASWTNALSAAAGERKDAAGRGDRRGTRNTAMRGQMRMGMQQLGFQMNDVASQMAMGTRASVIFAQQSAQVVQALQLMGGEGNAFLKFLGGPWGIALSVAVVALTPLIGKLFEAKDATAKLVDGLKEQEQKTRLSAQAQEIFDRSIDGSVAKMRELTKEIDAQNRTLEQNIELKKAASRSRCKTPSRTSARQR